MKRMTTKRGPAGAIALPLAVAFAAILVSGSAPAAERSATIGADEQKKTTPDQVIQRLKDGNERFVAGETHAQDWSAQVKGTAGGQHPLAIVLGCVDSRVPVEVVFDQGIGDIFTARVAGNIVNDEIVGSMEFATKVAGAKLVVVLGHTSCGAVKGACDAVQLGNILDLVQTIRPSVVAKTPAGETCSSKKTALVDEIATHNVGRTIEEIRTQSKILRDMEKAGEIRIVGAMYDIATGRVTFMDDAR